MIKKKQVCKLVDDLYWEYDRLSSSGQETLDELAKVLGLPTHETHDRLSWQVEEVNKRCGWNE